MDPRAIVDTGFLVALLSRTDRHHGWAKSLLPDLRGPWLTAESCVSETLVLLERAGSESAGKLCDWMEKRLLVSRHFLPDDLVAVRNELFRYRDRWVDLADACLVVLSDQCPQLPLVTVDRNDFEVYFRKRRGRRLLAPPP
jgi:uncharacterized protein